MKIVKICSFLGLLILVTIGAFIGYHLLQKKPQLISPVFGESKIRISDNVWFPQKPESFVKDGQIPEITAEAAFFIEGNSGQVLFEKNSTEKLPIASLTKIMTVIVTMENKEMSDKLVVSDQAAEMEPDKMYLKAGELLSVQELLEGIFLVSANDAAEVLAEQVTGRREEFINLMNSKAAQLGMNETNFINPSGLEEDDKSQLSSAYDVAVMARYAINKWPDLVNISSQPYIYMEGNERHQPYELFSGINLLTTYPGVLGFKTGYTPQAGLTLVTLARKDNKEVIGVLLGSINRRDDARALLDYSFKKLGVN